MAYHSNNTVTALEIIERLGGDTRAGSAACPICQPEARRDQRALSVQQDGGHLLMHCHKSGCSFIDLITALGLNGRSSLTDHAAILAAKQKRDEDSFRKLAKAQSKWNHAKPIIGTKGEQYLRGRGITCDLPDTLRWLADELHSPSGTWGTAMIGLVQPTGAIHRTHFDKQGNRMRSNAKLMLGSTKGGAVRLSQGQGPLVVCEGIETGLSLLSGLLSGSESVWAAMSATGMEGLDLPDFNQRRYLSSVITHAEKKTLDQKSLIIAVDGDKTGRNAGSKLAQRATLQGWRVLIMEAPDGQDFNDVLRGRNAA